MTTIKLLVHKKFFFIKDNLGVLVLQENVTVHASSAKPVKNTGEIHRRIAILTTGESYLLDMVSGIYLPGKIPPTACSFPITFDLQKRGLGKSQGCI